MTTLVSGKRNPIALFQEGSTEDPSVETNEHGNRIIRGLRVFRAGTFRDSMGYQHTWTREHLEQMVFHFDLLKGNGSFPNVPVRQDHSWSMRDVVGYFLSLYTDGDHLLADIELTEPSAAEKWDRGTYRGRSSEVGMYETNDESAYWPVLRGVAFVDIPAVEGLFAQRRAEITVLTEENSMTEQEWIAAAFYAQALADAEAAEADTRAAFYAQGLADAKANHRSSDHPPVAFRVNGDTVSDYTAVQNHITALETAAAEQVAAARTQFVEGLVTNHQITAAQGTNFAALVASMDDAQFTAFKAAYVDAPVNPLFSVHGASDGEPPAGQPNTLDDEIAVAEQTVQMHRRSNMTEEQVKKTLSYRKLQELKAQKAGK